RHAVRAPFEPGMHGTHQDAIGKGDEAEVERLEEKRIGRHARILAGHDVRKRLACALPRAHNAGMTLDSATCYRALRARDARFDGRFFVAVSSTRIYCRPVCTVKPPRRENCNFYPSAAAAEALGY